jgi:hypothetical protein
LESLVNCILWQPTIFYWLNLENFRWHYTLLFSTMACPPTLLLVVGRATSLSWHFAEQEFNTCHRSRTMCKPSWGLSHWQHDHIRITFEAFLAKERNSIHLLEKKLDYLDLKDFLKYESKLYLKQPLTPSQHKIIVAYCTLNYSPVCVCVCVCARAGTWGCVGGHVGGVFIGNLNVIWKLFMLWVYFHSNSSTYRFVFIYKLLVYWKLDSCFYTKLFNGM